MYQLPRTVRAETQPGPAVLSSPHPAQPQGQRPGELTLSNALDGVAVEKGRAAIHCCGHEGAASVEAPTACAPEGHADACNSISNEESVPRPFDSQERQRGKPSSRGGGWNSRNPCPLERPRARWTRESLAELPRTSTCPRRRDRGRCTRGQGSRPGAAQGRSARRPKRQQAPTKGAEDFGQRSTWPFFYLLAVFLNCSIFKP